MNILGMETFKSVATRKTEMDIEIEEGIRIAEKKFEESIEKYFKKRHDDQKPLFYDPDYYDD